MNEATLVEKLRTSPNLRRMIEEADHRDDQDRAMQRQAALAELTAANTWHDAELAELTTAHRDVLERIEQLQSDLAAARRQRGELSRQIQRIMLERAARSDTATQTLRKLIPPQWGEFMAELRTMEAETRAALKSRPITASVLATLAAKPARGEECNGCAVETRLLAIANVRSAVTEIAVTCPSDNIETEISRLRRMIPGPDSLDTFTATRETVISGIARRMSELA